MLGDTEAYGSFKSKLESLPGNVIVIASHTQMDSRKEKVSSGRSKFLMYTYTHIYYSIIYISYYSIL